LPFFFFPIRLKSLSGAGAARKLHPPFFFSFRWTSYGPNPRRFSLSRKEYPSCSANGTPHQQDTPARQPSPPPSTSFLPARSLAFLRRAFDAFSFSCESVSLPPPPCGLRLRRTLHVFAIALGPLPPSPQRTADSPRFSFFLRYSG